MEKLNVTCLPPKEKFLSSLTNEGISKEDYTRAQEVWKKFGCKTLWDYSEVYLKTDIAILTDVFEDFRKMAKNPMDWTHYGTTQPPDYPWTQH